MARAALIHHGEGPAGPTQAGARAQVAVFEGAHQLVEDEAGCDLPHHAPQPVTDDVEFFEIGNAAHIPVRLGVDDGADQITGSVKGAELLVQGRGRVERDGNAGDVHELKRTHADAEGCLGRRFDGGDVGGAFVYESHRLIEPRNKESINNKSGRVSGCNRGLTAGFLDLPSSIKCLLRCVLALDDFDEAVLSRMIKVVQANHTVFMLANLCNIIDVEAAGVGGEQGFLAQALVEILKERGLDLEVFKDGFNHEGAALERVFVRREGHAP